MSTVITLIAGAALGIGGLFAADWIASSWRRRKYVSRMDADKAGRLFYDLAVEGHMAARDGGVQYRFGYEWCLNNLFGEDYEERVSAESERKWLNKKYPVKEAQP